MHSGKLFTKAKRVPKTPKDPKEPFADGSTLENGYIGTGRVVGTKVI